METSRSLPSLDRLGVLTAVIVLAYSLARLLEVPGRSLHMDLLGTPLDLQITGRGLVLLLVAALISTGSDTLIRSHPRYAGSRTRRTVIHWIVPGATALVLGAALNQLPNGPAWWLGLAGSAAALLAVLVTEYRVVDAEASGHAGATVALASLAYGLAFILFWLLRTTGLRAAISASVSGLVAAALAWRLFVLSNVPPRRAGVYAGLLGALIAELTWAANYWLASAGLTGLVVMVCFYSGVGLARQHLAGRLSPRAWLEYGAVGLLGLGLAWLIGVAR